MRRFLSAVLLLSLLAAVLFSSVSCGASTEDPSRSGSSGGKDGAGAVLTAEELVGYSILRDDSAKETGIRNGMKLREAMEAEGYSLRLTTDFYKEGIAGMEILPNEILVGQTNREETAEFLSSLTPWQWGYALIGTKIVIAGHSDEATTEAVDAFIENIVKRAPLSFSESDRYVFGDVVKGEGRIYSVLTAYAASETNLSEEDILRAVEENSPEIVILVRKGTEEGDESLKDQIVRDPLLKDDLPEGYAVGFAGAAGETVTEIYFLESAYTFSAGEQARLLSYPNLSESEKGALTYSVLRCRDTGKKLLFAAADLPDDGYSTSRMRTVTSFLSHVTAYPTAVFGADLGLGSKTSTVSDDFFAAGFTPASEIAERKEGENDGDSALFFRFADTAVVSHTALLPGLSYDEFQEAAN